MTVRQSDPSSRAAPRVDHELELLLKGELADPHSVLGAHPIDGGIRIRTLRPGAQSVELVLPQHELIQMKRIHRQGVFECRLQRSTIPKYRFRIISDDSEVIEEDPYRFLPTLGEVDLHLIGEGRHEYMWRVMGAHIRSVDGIEGVSFAVWAPAAKGVRVVGDFNSWDGTKHPMRVLGSSGIWELFLPGVGPGSLYKFEISTATGAVVLKADPFAFATEPPPLTASRIPDADYTWGDKDWMTSRGRIQVLDAPMSIYECHIGSWRRSPESGEVLSYRQLAEELADYLVDMGFTHVQFLPVAEHPFGGSWGYQVSAYFAPSARFGSPDDFRYLVDHLHQRGIGVLIDWVPAHFPKDDFALARFDGTALFEHEDPRQGEHPDWGTLVFNFGRNEVRNFLLSNAAFWCEEYHVDGLRVDAVASMLYLDYSRKKGEWIPNRFGGRENLEAVEFLRQLNTMLFARYPGVTTIAEESTAWPAVSRPVYVGGLGFGFKWNMGWMHDTLQYFSKDPIHRRYHHNMLTFGLLYAWHENFVLPLSHDEVVHGKGSLLGKMPGDRWQRFANLRSLLAWMWAHPGKQLLFMGGEIGQEREWSHDESIDWHLLDDDLHTGVQRLVREMNTIYSSQPPLFAMDFDAAGFQWIDANDTEQNVFSFLRFAPDGSPLACVANLSPLPRRGYRVGLPLGGQWHEVLNSDDPQFGGSGVLNPNQIHATGIPWHGFGQSVDLDLPPLGVIWLSGSIGDQQGH